MRLALVVSLSHYQRGNTDRDFRHDYSRERTAYRGAYRKYDWENLLFVLIHVPYLGVLDRDCRKFWSVPITAVRPRQWHFFSYSSLSFSACALSG
jgi:hypothetical protein